MTIIEMMVALAIFGLLVWASVGGLARVTKSDLRADAARLAAVLRSGYDRAAATAAHHRVVLDLDEETFHLERCEGKVKLYRTIDEAQQAEREALAAKAQSSPDAQTDQAALAAGAQVGGAACGPVKGELGKPQALKRKRGMGIHRVWVGHLEQPATSGKVTVNFFPMGRAERAIVEVASDDGDVYSLLVHAITGRVEIRTGEWRRAEEFVREGEAAR